MEIVTITGQLHRSFVAEVMMEIVIVVFVIMSGADQQEKDGQRQNLNRDVKWCKRRNFSLR